MNHADFELQALSDPRLAVHAVGSLPAWLWSADGSRVLWANAMAARALGAANSWALVDKRFGPADQHRRQVAQLARRLPENGAIRLERLRGFGAPLGALATCGCAMIDLPDGMRAVLITGTDNSGRSWPLTERLRRLVENSGLALIAFTAHGEFAGISTAGRRLFGIHDLSAPLFADVRNEALTAGFAEIQFGDERAVLHRVGAGSQIGLVAVPAPAPAVKQAEPNADVPVDAVPVAETAATPPHPANPAPEVAAECPPPPSMDAMTERPLDDETSAQSREAAAAFAPLDEPAVQAPPVVGIDRPEPTSSIAAETADADATAFAQSDLAPAADAPPQQDNTTVSTRDGSVASDAPPIDDGGLEAAGNVVPFRPAGETRHPALTPVENNAFHELARQLSARLEGDNRNAPADAAAATHEPAAQVTEPFDAPHVPTSLLGSDASDQPTAGLQAEWLTPEQPPAQGDSQRDRILLDLLPTGMLIYRLDRLLYANPAFFKQMGYTDLATLEQAGGLDALYVEPGAPAGSGKPEVGTPVTISAADGSSSEEIKAEARLFTITWDGDSAHALIFAPAPGPAATAVSAPAETGSAPAPAPAAPAPLVLAPPPVAGHADAEDLAAILDVTAEGILMFDAGGNIHACNRSAEAMFGYDGTELVRRNIIELFAPESARLVLDHLDRVQQAGTANVPEPSREVLGKVAQGGAIPLSMTIGRTRQDGPNFFAVFRDLSQLRRGESELLQARRVADRAASAKADMLARISHEVRAPLNAIIGFAEVMIGERFGTLGNTRYAEYMKDIRASGERVVSLIDDLLELSRIETGRLELAFTSQNLNELVEGCVAVMQPHANRARIIIRTSLSQSLPPVIADARALRQIAMNLISTSISLANAGGQVIVSTATSDFGEVVLRVRDTGHGLNDQAVAAALEPFRATAGAEQGHDGSGLSLSLTKALVEANRAQFHIKAAPKSGTLLEVVFSRAVARNQSTA